MGKQDMVVSNSYGFGAIPIEAVEAILNTVESGIAYCQMVYIDGNPVNFKYLYTNAAFHQFTGLGEVVGRFVTDVLPYVQERHPELFEIYGRVAADGPEEAFEIYIPTIKRQLSVKASCPKRGYFLAVFTGEVERRSFIERIDRLTAEQKALYNSDLIGVAVIKERTVVSCNQAIASMLGYSIDELIGKPTSGFYVTQETYSELAQLAQESIQSGRTVRTEQRLLCKDGAVKYFAVSACEVQPGTGIFLTVFVDVTEMEDAKESIRKTKDRLQLVLDASELGTWEYDSEQGKVTYNERWCGMLGYKVTQVASTLEGWHLLVHPEDIDAVREAFKSHLEGNTAFYECEHRLRHRDGHWVWVLSRGRVLERGLDNTPIRAAGTHLDISHTKKLVRDTNLTLGKLDALIKQLARSMVGEGSDHPLQDDEANTVERLTDRQREILALVAAGSSSASIAKQLQISAATVVTHRRNLMRTLNIHSVADLTRFAMKHRIV